LQNVCAQLEALVGHGFEGSVTYQFSLIKPALAALGHMQGNGYNQNAIRKLQLGNRGREHSAKNRSRWMHLVILQQVDQLTQFGIVRAISDRLLIWREFLLAITAESYLSRRIGLRQTLATGFAGWP
jgi:hypothetical protein